MTPRSLALIVVVGGLTLAPRARAQNDRARSVSLDAAAQAVELVKARYLAMDYIGGAAEADRLLKQFPTSRRLAAWRVANLARINKPKEADAAVAALLMNKNDPWGWFARTFVQEYSAGSTAAEVLQTSLEAYRRAPLDPDVVWLRAFALANNDQGTHALALIDSAAARGRLSQTMVTLRATALFAKANVGLKTDQAMADSSFALYARARASDTTDAAANTFAASRMLNSGRTAEAYALAKRGAELSPLSLPARETYWRAIDGLKDRTQAGRDSEVIADVERLLQTRGTEPTVLLSASHQFESHRMPARAREMETRVLAVAPTSASAEWVHVNRYRAVAEALRDSTSRDTAAYLRALWAFVDRPTHVQDRLIGDAYRNLFAYTDSTTNADTLLRIVRGMVKYEGINPHVVYAGGAIRLAERGRDFKEAEQIARDGMKEAKRKIDSQKSIYETVGDYARAVDWMSAFMYDALGVVYFRQNRLDDAERELEHARELDPNSSTALLHLAQLNERRGDLAKAEQLYIKGALLPALGKNLNRAALQRLYKARTGSLDGYDAYLAAMSETDRASRKAEIAKTRIAAPAPLAPFHLKTLDGKEVSLDSLRGKTAVINNWGMWCGPCVAEMPDFQKLSAQFANDSTVRVLTIDNDPNTDALREWMQKKGYTFTTLLDDGYLSRSNLHTFPTTWFLDATGNVVFSKQGWSEKLIEEFGWRIDMIRRPATVP